MLMRAGAAPTRSRLSRSLRLQVMLVGVATLVFAACGSSSSKTASTNTTTKTASTNRHSVIVSMRSSTLGRVLVDDKAITLYTLTSAGRPVACTGQCATVWPPLLLPSGMATPTAAAGVTGLGVVAANGG